MRNRDRDSISQSERPTDAGDVNRRTEEERGRNSGTDARFGQSIGRSEDNQGGEMRNKNEEKLNDRNQDRNEETSRREGSGSFGSSTGRSGSVGNKGGGGADISREESRNPRPEQPMGNRDDRSDSSEGRH
jgi:hypothetical protein